MNRHLVAALLLGPLVAGAQVVSTTPPAEQPPVPQPQMVPPPPPASPVPPDTSALAPQPPEPYAGPAVREPSPQYVPPPSSDESMPPPAVAQVAPSYAGQWVYTSQYGWVWMPYGSGYTAVTAGDYPEMYLYAPAFGWRWVVAPWVWGLGPRPYFGVFGWARFGWYGFHGGGPVWAMHPAWGHGPWVAPHVAARPFGVAHPVYASPRPGGFGRPGPVVQGRPGGFARPAPVQRRSGGFARPAPSGGFGRSGGFGGGHRGGAGHR